ncbi:hypothetical protein A3F29_00355 [Candidatus Roizmanbacteria bacterium RIFCSPHIGHO2_12_FULL_33_9]|uniref:Membrane protein 6-pyruvoyl-tetrahydropterin synthase-related domain-containing protein n=1 Tax=Candidatus Roizmanbacteria bacterium RIFCSPHIGHO2_12_FULL_33_9 TaxID=1802045 RepID=A0A1F7HI49_9BACT|nr:MAG: hypothetical protein A3F29_00355 [Candidatus Roizmanbacteria bacterium RIFCSPHIGHO2_12_FULL_33_9]
MIKRIQLYIVPILFIIIIILFFRAYFFQNKVPFPSNLLVSFYEPWKSYKWEGYASGPSNKPIGFDNLRISYPIRKITTEQIKNFNLPLWNPYYFSGNTLLATYQSAGFHPLGFLFLILPQIDAWSIIIIFTPFFSSIFMYLFLRELGLTKKSSFFGSIVFAFSGLMIAWWEESLMSGYSILFLPLILYGIEKTFKKISTLNYLTIVLGLVFSIFSGWFQTTFYVLIFSFLWLIFRSFNFKKLNYFFLVLNAYILSILISAVHLFPSLEAYMYSARGSTDAKFIFEIYFAQLYHLATFIAPDFFGNPGTYNYIGTGFYYEKVIFIGIPGLIFGLYELIKLKKVTNSENFFKIVFLISLSLGFALPTSWLFLYYLKLPFFSVILPSRIFFISIFSFSVLCSFGIEKFFKIKEKKILIVLGFLLCALLLLWTYATFYKTKHYDDQFGLVPLKNLILPSVIFLIMDFLIIFYLIKKKSANIVYFGIISISLFSSLYFANKYLYFSERKFVFPTVPVISQLQKITGLNRFWSVGEAYIDRNFSVYYKLFSPEGYDSFYIRRYGELMYAGLKKGKYSKQIPRTDATVRFAKDIAEIAEDPYRKKMLSILSVSYVVSKNTDPYKNSGDFKRIWFDNYFSIYRNKNALPRAFLLGSFIKENDPQRILNALFEQKNDLSKTVILEETPKNFKNSENIKGSAKIASYEPISVIIRTQSNTDSLLFLSDNYYPGWNAYIDSLPTKIYRANYSFRSVVVSKGSHVVAFKYEPKSFYYGILATIFGLIFLVLTCFGIKKLNEKFKN